MFRVLDLFSGIGGFSLGLERTGGFQTVAFCEIDPYCRRVLRKHWPNVPQYEDVRTLTAERLATDGINADVICGGFPCQDISVAGKGAGIEGERSGLWSEYARIIGEIRPRYVIVENVAALLGRGLSRVLGDLAPLGFDAEWHCIPASAVGAPHRRDRVWIVAHPQHGRGEHPRYLQTASNSSDGEYRRCTRCRFVCYDDECGPGFCCPRCGSNTDVADAASDGRGQGRTRRFDSGCAWEFEQPFCDADGARLAIGKSLTRNDVAEFAATVGANWWGVEPSLDRVADGVSDRVDRLSSLGNAVVPQIPEMIGLKILETENAIHSRT